MLRRDENHFWAEKECGGRFGADFEKKMTPHPYVITRGAPPFLRNFAVAVTNSSLTQTG